MLRNRVYEFIKGREVAVMCGQTARELPYTLYGIELRAVGRQELERYDVAPLIEPGTKKFCVMPARIVNDDDHPASCCAMACELLQERLETLGVERLLQAGNETTIPDANRAEDANALARRLVQHDRVDILRRNPHDAS